MWKEGYSHVVSHGPSRTCQQLCQSDKPDNLQTLCWDCHRKKTKREASKRK
ncbi:MAG: HNH endonuclease [Planctomycetaceae bacterium]|nr:HNH endonuclease [Planctomycetaceae bacterium]